MQNQSGENKYAFDRPGTYSIRVLGFVDESWSERLAGMRISTVSLDDKGPVTTLVGSVVDQAALSGVLETLYESHLTLLSVEMLEVEKY
ncbi:MAG: hypothetical protein WBM78_14190 [Desulfobacterales bacterium]